jgi:hypothetical protein
MSKTSNDNDFIHTVGSQRFNLVFEQSPSFQHQATLGRALGQRHQPASLSRTQNNRFHINNSLLKVLLILAS